MKKEKLYVWIRKAKEEISKLIEEKKDNIVILVAGWSASWKD